MSNAQSTKINPEAMKYRQALREARQRYYTGQGSLTELEQAADDYIAYLRRRKADGLKIRIPTRAYLIRAI